VGSGLDSRPEDRQCLGVGTGQQIGRQGRTSGGPCGGDRRTVQQGDRLPVSGSNTITTA
jgi:hypothetical protein